MKKIELPSKSKQILLDLQNHTHRLYIEKSIMKVSKSLSLTD